MDREINLIVLHCSATPAKMDIGVDEITDWHVNGNKWSDIGYHFVIKRNGLIEEGRPLEKAGAHAKGFNTRSIGICIVGGTDDNGKPEDNKTLEQEKSLAELIFELQLLFPGVKVIGHNEVSSKDCPSFDVQEWLNKNGYEEI